MFEDFAPLDIEVAPSLTIHGLRSGTGSPLLLLHGFPQNLNIWPRVAPSLTKSYTVILLDLRGYGQSSKPTPPPSDVAKHVTYSKRSMAEDCIAVMKTHLGFSQFYICAHDRGARVAHRLAVDYPDVVLKAIFLDICPTLAMYSQTNMAFATAYAHWFFLIKPAPFPEKLILGSPEVFAEGHMGPEPARNPQGKGVQLFEKEAWESYVDMLRDEKGVHAMCEDYRASATIDMEQAREDVEHGRKIKCPLLVIWGGSGVVEKMFDAVKEWSEVCEKEVEGFGLEGCGHYIPEERPEELVENVLRFLK